MGDHPVDLGTTGERIEALLDASAAGGIVARERAEELVRLVSDLYGAGLERVLDVVHERGGLDDDTVDVLARDDLVSGLLLVHGLHPWPLEQRVEQAVAALPGAELVGIGPGPTVTVRVEEASGCGSHAATADDVEEAVAAAAPEVDQVAVETRPAGPAVIATDALRVRLREAPS